MEQTVEDLCRKLKPVIGRRAEMFYMNYLFSNPDERKEIELYLHAMCQKVLGKDPLEKDDILLEPPPQELTGGGYPVGSVVYNKNELYPFGLRESEWIQHVGIFGRSGAGKTNTCCVIIKSLIEHGKPFLIFDWKRNYRDLAALFSEKDILIFTVGRNIAPIQFNPLVPPEGTEPTIWLKKLIEIIATTYYVGEGVISLLLKAIDSVYQKFGMYTGNPSIYPTMRDVLNYIDNYPAKGREANWMISTVRTLQAMCYGEMGRVINTESRVPVADLLKQNVIFELDALTNTDKTFFIESLLLYIHHYRLNKPVREQFQHAIIIEEAHHVLRKQETTKNESIIDVTLREIRELGEAIIYLDQLPSQISVPALGNTNCSITMNLKSRQCVSTAASYTLIDNEHKDMFGKLPTGFAIVKIQSRCPNPFLIKIPHIPTPKGKVTDRDVKERMETYFSHSRPDVREPPEIAAVAAPNEVSDIEREFLVQVYKHPYNGTVEKYKRLGLTRKKGHKVRQVLIERGLLLKKSIPTRTGQIVLMEPTAKGKELLRSMGHKISDNPAEGGAEHRYWVQKIASWYQAKGYAIEIEKKISSNEACDIEVTDTNGNKFVVEVQTSEANLEKNIRKNIEAGYKKIVFFATNYKAREGIKGFLMQKLFLPEDAEIELLDWNAIY